MKDFQWLVVEMGYDNAKDHINKLKEKINIDQPYVKSLSKIKKKKWLFF